MKVLSFPVKLLILLAAVLPPALLYLATGRDAAVSVPPLTESGMEEIQQLLINNDPQRLLDRDERILRLTENEANALLTYFIHTVPRLRDVAGHVSLNPSSATLDVSAAIRGVPFHDFLNMELSVVERERQLVIESLHLGALRIPGSVIGPLLRLGRPYLERDENYRLFMTLVDTIDGVSLGEESVEIMLDWREENLADIQTQARQVFIPDEERERLLRYYGGIGEIAGALPDDQRDATLNEFLRPLFATARERSGSGADPVAENRAAFIALSVYMNEIELEQLAGPLPEDASYAPRRLAVKVGPREDLAQHVVTAAAIAASAGAAAADVLSVYKEVHDSRYRTGFSFSDLTANQVGSALGHLATRGEADARRLQDFLAESRDESDYMPPVERFDGITEQEFINQFQDRASENYQQRLREIDEAIAERPLFLALETPPQQ